MAIIKRFSDYTGNSVELTYVSNLPNNDYKKKFPGAKGIRFDGYSMWVGRVSANSELLPVTRAIEYKSQPSKHECNAKCVNGSHKGICECKCGGKNHGIGMFTGLLSQNALK